MSDVGDVRLQLNDLEAEEARIMRELRELDEKAQAETQANKRRAEQYKDDPETAMTSSLLECEKEVRDAKGYIADQGPPLRIVRLRHGETGPKSATYLSRPRNTGVDFTVPVTLKAYTDLIKRPIFLNQIRDKIKQHKYPSTKEFLEDVRLLVRNTAQFNKGPDLAWVVQHARFLLEAAEDAVASRRTNFRDIEEALSQRSAQKTTRQNAPSLTAAGKRKRAHTQDKTNGELSAIPAVGSAIEIYWPSYRKWYLAYITAHGDEGTCHLRYDEDNSLQWVTLDHERWRMRNSRFTGAARGKRANEQPAKRRKAATAASQTTDPPVYVPGGITPEDLDAIKIDLFAKFDDLRDSIVEQLKDHFARIDRAIIRSDTLSRILVQMQDTQTNVEGAVRSIHERLDSLEKRICGNQQERVVTQREVPSDSEPPSHEGASKKQGLDKKDRVDKVGNEDSIKHGNRDPALDYTESKTPSHRQTEREKKSERVAEKETETPEVNSNVENEVKMSHSEVAKRDIGEIEPSAKRDELSPNREQNVDKPETKVVSKEGSAIEVEPGPDEAAELSKVDTETVDVADEDRPAKIQAPGDEEAELPKVDTEMVEVVDEDRPEKIQAPGDEAAELPKADTEMVEVVDEDRPEKIDAGLPEKENDSKALGQGNRDSTAHAPRRNRLIKDDLVDLEADAKAEAAEDRMEESSDSKDPSDSESSRADEGKRVAGKQPAIRREPESKIESMPKSRVSEDQNKMSGEANAGEKQVGVEVSTSPDGIDNEERKKAVADVPAEKPPEEIEKAAILNAGNEVLEEEKGQSSCSRERKEVDDEVGD